MKEAGARSAGAQIIGAGNHEKRKCSTHSTFRCFFGGGFSARGAGTRTLVGAEEKEKKHQVTHRSIRRPDQATQPWRAPVPVLSSTSLQPRTENRSVQNRGLQYRDRERTPFTPSPGLTALTRTGSPGSGYRSGSGFRTNGKRGTTRPHLVLECCRCRCVTDTRDHYAR